ncbi:hypothetical protein [Neobacillus niacini]|nr:hypothetical protein [Neobacillus niacini]MCM3764145.1 hypothetical protein [Neobacillus niacini]
MSCCSPNYRETVNEHEEKINQNEKDRLPLLAKIMIVVITAGAVGAAFLL